MDWATFDRKFYEVSALELAPRLLGHWLVRAAKEASGTVRGAHRRGRGLFGERPGSRAPSLWAARTARNEIMWGPPGFGYVYLIYGMHYCFNAVCLPPGRAEAVLVRAIEADLNAARMRPPSPRSPASSSLTNGPAKLCQALGITRLHDGVDLCQTDSPVFIARNHTPEKPRRLSGRSRSRPDATHVGFESRLRRTAGCGSSSRAADSCPEKEAKQQSGS